MAAKEAAIARFLQEYPQAADVGRRHPALDGCEEIRWSEFPQCPAALPALLYRLLDPAAATEAQRVLINTLFTIAEMNPAVPHVLPFLLRLADEPQVPERSRLLEYLTMVADYSEPVETANEALVQWFGSDSEHPERERCRAVFAQHAHIVETLPDGLIAPACRARLRRAAGLV
ncbi:hypothetical protein AB0K68_20180 [Streptomyces sp. NPDC050698]